MHRPDQDARVSEGRLRDERFMREALAVALGNDAPTSPNPSVGAVLVRDGVVLSRGATQAPGGNHAEIEALRACEDPSGATLYLTLEPCCGTHKRTPPCVDAIVRAKVARVVVGIRDPNPAVDGKGIAALREAGIEVEEGVLEDDARRCHEAFAKWIAAGEPLVTLKLALTLDGMLTWGDGRRKAITGERARERVHAMRARSDAVLVGIGTVLADDPQLTARLAPGKSPLRVVLDSQLRIPPGAALLREQGRVLVFCAPGADASRRARLERLCEIAQAPALDDGELDLRAVMASLGERGVTSVLVEGGRTLSRSLLEAGLVDKLVVLVAPFTAGEGTAAFEGLSGLSLSGVRVEQLGEDAMIDGYVGRKG